MHGLWMRDSRERSVVRCFTMPFSFEVFDWTTVFFIRHAQGSEASCSRVPKRFLVGFFVGVFFARCRCLLVAFPFLAPPEFEKQANLLT